MCWIQKTGHVNTSTIWQSAHYSGTGLLHNIHSRSSQYFSQDCELSSHTTYDVFVNYIHEWQRTYCKQQIFEKLFMAILLTSGVFVRNLLREEVVEEVFFYIRFLRDGWHEVQIVASSNKLTHCLLDTGLVWENNTGLSGQATGRKNTLGCLNKDCEQWQRRLLQWLTSFFSSWFRSLFSYSDHVALSIQFLDWDLGRLNVNLVACTLMGTYVSSL